MTLLERPGVWQMPTSRLSTAHSISNGAFNSFTSPMNVFSDELLLEIFRQLPLSESLTLCRVCKRWRQLVWTHLRTQLEIRFLSNANLYSITFDEIDDLFAMLRLKHREILPLVSSSLRNLTSVQHIRTYLQQQKATNKFLRMIVGSNSLQVCRDAIVSLSMLCCHGELSSKQTVWQAIMEDSNAHVLIQHIHSPESEIEMHMLGIIGNIASDLQLQNQLVKWNAIPPILRVLKKGFDLSSEHAVRVVLNFCEGERETKETLILNGAVSALMRHLGSEEYELDIWRCLFRLAEGAVSSEGVVSATFQTDLLRNGVLEHLRSSTNDWAFELRSMLDVHPFLVEIARYEDIAELVHHIENSSDPMVSSQASMILCGIASIEKYRPLLCRDKLIHVFVKLLTTPEFILMDSGESNMPSSTTSYGESMNIVESTGNVDQVVFVPVDSLTASSDDASPPVTQVPEQNAGSDSPPSHTSSSSAIQQSMQVIDYPGFQVKENIALALSNFSDDDHLFEISSVPGFLPISISMLSSQSPYVQEAACQLISTVVQYGNTSNKFRQSGGIDALALLFQQTKSERVIAVIMKTMTNLSLDFNDRNVDAMHKASMLGHLFDYVQSQSYDLVHNLTECLWCLSISDDTRTFLREHQLFYRVLGLLDSRDFEIRCNVSGMLGNLMTMDSVSFWKGKNITSMLYPHLRDFAQMVCEHVLQMLAGLCHDCHYDPKLHRDYLEDILELLEQGDEEVSEHAAGTLTPLTCYSDICSADLSELGFLSTMVTLLKIDRVRTFLPLAVLYNVIKSTHDAQTFVHLRGMHYLSRLLCTTPDHDITWVATACFSMIIEVHSNFAKEILSRSHDFQAHLRQWLEESDNPLHQSCASWLLMFFGLDQPQSDLIQTVRKSATNLLRCITQEEHAEHVLRVMARLCTLDSQYLEIIQKAGAMQSFMKAIDYEEESFQSQNINTAILWALTNMLEDNDDGVDAFIRLGGLSCALRFLKKSSSDWAKVPAAAIVTMCFNKHHSNGSMSQSASGEELAAVLGEILISTGDSALKCYSASALASVLQYNSSTVASCLSTPIATTFTQSKRCEALLTGDSGLQFLIHLSRSKSGHLRRIAFQSLGTLAAANRICLKAIKDEKIVDMILNALHSSDYYDMLWTCVDTLTVLANCDMDLQLQICESMVFPFKEQVWPNTRLRSKIDRLQASLLIRQDPRALLTTASSGFGLTSLSKTYTSKDETQNVASHLNYLKNTERRRKHLPGLQSFSTPPEDAGHHRVAASRRPGNAKKKTLLMSSIDFDELERADKHKDSHANKSVPSKPTGIRPSGASTTLPSRAKRITYDSASSILPSSSVTTHAARKHIDGDSRYGSNLNSNMTNQTLLAAKTGKVCHHMSHTIQGLGDCPHCSAAHSRASRTRTGSTLPPLRPDAPAANRSRTHTHGASGPLSQGYIPNNSTVIPNGNGSGSLHMGAVMNPGGNPTTTISSGGSHFQEAGNHAPSTPYSLGVTGSRLPSIEIEWGSNTNEQTSNSFLATSTGVPGSSGMPRSAATRGARARGLAHTDHPGHSNTHPNASSTSNSHSSTNAHPPRRNQTRAQLRAQQKMQDVAMCYLGRPTLYSN